MFWRVVLSIVFGLVAILAVAGWAVGLYGYERHSGYFAPVWNEDGSRIYALRRSTAGFTWGLGWEFFTPPASARVTSDTYAIIEIDPATGAERQLASWSESPVVGRVMRNYRGRIFIVPQVRLAPVPGGLDIRVGLGIPRIPTTERWSIHDIWRPDAVFQPRWSQDFLDGMSTPEDVLRNGREVMAVPGPEGYGAAILIVEENGEFAPVATMPSFARAFPGGVSADWVADRSRRERIERQRAFRTRHAELKARFLAQGLSDGAASLRAYDVMEEEGLLPRSPRIVATEVDAVAEGLTVFDIPEDYLTVGLFQDIAAAIATPGSEVKSSTGTYLKYYDDDLGPRLKRFREDTAADFAIRVSGRLYLIENR